MNVATRTLSIKNPHKRAFSFYNIFFIALALLTIFGIVVVKSRTSIELGSVPLFFVYSYSILITTFQFSRFGTILFYKPALKRSIQTKEESGGRYEPMVSFIVPCFNEEKVIEETVQRCIKVNYPPEKLEVLVIDDGSSDKSPQILDSLNGKYSNLTVIKFKKNRGKRHAQVEGFKKAKGEILVQIDSDSYVEAESFYKLIEPFKNPEIGATCAHADPTNSDKNFITKMQAAYYYMSFRILKAVESTFEAVFCCSGCAAAYRKSAVLDILDEWSNEKFLGLSVMYGDDRSLTTRVIQGGYKTIYVWDAQAYTIVPEKFKKLMVQQIRWKKSWIVNAFKTGRFILFKRPVTALFYFYPLVLISFMNPFIAVYALVYTPIFHQTVPVIYLAGLVLVNLLVVVYYRVIAPDNRYWPYLFAWGALSILVLTPLLFYAAIRIQDRGWGTR